MEKPYYVNVDMSKYIALIIDNLNHDASLSELLTPTRRIKKIINKHRKNLIKRGMIQEDR